MWVNIYGDDTGFNTSWVIVIPYLNSGGLLLFSILWPMFGWPLVWILLFARSALVSDIPVAYSATWLVCGVFGRAGGSARCMGMGFCAIPTCMLVLGVWCCFCCYCGWDWGHQLHLLTALTVLDQRPIALRLSAMAMWVMNVWSILAVVALRSRESNFLTTSLSVRAQTRCNWTFYSFSLSAGKLHLLARALRWSTSSSGVSPGFVHTSSNWYIQHCWDTVWSFWDAKWSRKDFALFLVAAISSVVTLVGVHWFYFQQPMSTEEI